MIWWERINMPVKKQQFITFKIAEQVLAAPLNKDSQFFSCEHLLSLPINNKYLAGVSYLNGQLVTILRTDKFFGLNWKMPSNPQCLHFSYHEDFYGLAVDQGLDTVSATQIFQEKTKSIFNKYIKINKQKVYIVEPEQIFSELKIYV
jgi:chemotaxis signal transduction protein